ncbi:hypothetical protein L2E82_45680 [Cichorium intybus]|uniref:Uncharacterized protein n=1 Tax=Cichorium intybus TaxID=13427 RepID=A0ACB8ZU07_CICIN|nr:hypothetical protein L2E82_45680 [Cichorium intybus]
MPLNFCLPKCLGYGADLRIALVFSRVIDDMLEGVSLEENINAFMIVEDPLEDNSNVFVLYDKIVAEALVLASNIDVNNIVVVFSLLLWDMKIYCMILWDMKVKALGISPHPTRVGLLKGT